MIFLVDLGTHNGVVAGTVRVGTNGYTTKPTDVPANKYYLPRVKAAGSIERKLSPFNRPQVSAGTVNIVNGKPYGGMETLDDWIDLAFRNITIRSIDNTAQPFAQAVTRFIGTCEGLNSTRALSGFDLSIRDRLSDLDRPLLKATYAGTTISAGLGIEGNVDLKDRLKPRIWGNKHNVSPVAVNVFDLIYQVSAGAVNSIVVYDGGFALTSSGNFSSVAALTSATLVPGRYGTCLSAGVFRLGGSPAFSVTADVVEGSSLSLRSAAQIASRMLSAFATTYGETFSIDATSLAALSAANGAECGILIDSDETAGSAIARMLASVGGWILPDPLSATAFDVGRFAVPSGTAVASFNLDDNIGGDPEMIETGQDGDGFPSYRVMVRYDKLGVTQVGSDLVGAVTDTRRSYLKDEWRQALAENLTVRTQYPRAPVLMVDTCLVNQVDAAAEAARLLALHGVRRKCWRLTVPIEDAEDADLASMVTLRSNAERMGMGSGVLTLVIGRLDDFGASVPSVTLDLWH